MPRRRPSWPTGSWSPEPPRALPPGRVVHLPGRGETFVRDTEGNGPVLLLLHGWMVSADLNWFTAYDALAEAGFRVLALDHRGHGRGLRTHAHFRLTDCAEDAAALLDHLGIERAFVAGYSMGGPIAQLLARARPDLVAGLVLCATSRNWRHPRVRVIWQTMAGLRLLLGVAPEAVWRRGLRSVGFPDAPVTAWFAAELTRGSARDVAEAGRELGRFDSSGWVGSLTPPAAVVVTTKDTAVPPRHQRGLATGLGAPTFEVDGDHGAVTEAPDRFNPVLLRALAHVGAPAGVATPV